MLERLFKSKTLAKMMGILIFEKPLHIREIAKRIEAQPIQVKKELENLLSFGVVSNTRVGNLSVWEIDKDSALYAPLRTIYLNTEGAGHLLREKLAANSKIQFAFIYGSFASGEERGDSDVDLMLVGSISPREALKLVKPAEREIGREINYTIYPEAEFSGKHASGFVKNVLLGKKVMLKGSENGLKQLAQEKPGKENTA